ncbi:unnamed protein product [Scytosiphon promiscuus]
MKWPKGKKRNGSSKKKKAADSSSSSKSADSPGLGTLRLGTLRPESAPICTPTPTSRRQLISDLLTDDEEDTSAVTASPALRSIISNKSSTGCVDSKKGTGDSFTSYTSEEKAVFASHLNAHLVGDPFVTHLMPLDPGGTNFFDSFKDGVLMCRLVCLAIPGSIADAKINVPTGDEPLSLYRANENLNVALRVAEEAGLQVVNIGATDIIQGRPASILGLTWQLIRVHLLAQINLKGCPDLIHLMEEGESREAFFELPVEEVLLRWINHHLRWGGSERRVSNFAEDLADGRCYITLIKELNDRFDVEENDPHEEEDAKRARFRRACLVISGAEGIGLAPLIRANHITGKAHLYNIAFVAQLLNRRPRIHRESLHLDASVAMQAWFRMVSVMRCTRPVLEKRRASGQTISRACARWMALRKQQRAATTMQAMWRGRSGRTIAANRRFIMAKRFADEAEARSVEQAARLEREAAEEEAKRKRDVEEKEAQLKREAEEAQARAVEQAARLQREAEEEEARAAAQKAKLKQEAEEKEATLKREAQEKEAQLKREAEEAQARAAEKAAELKREAQEQEARAAKQAAKLKRQVAALERRKRLAAATSLQAWARGVSTRQAISDALEARGLPLLMAEQRRRDSWGAKLKGSQTEDMLSARTSVASSARMSEDSAQNDGSAPQEGSRSWFDKVFTGISFRFPDMDRGNGGGSAKTHRYFKRAEAAAAMVIQRWQRRLVEKRLETARAQQEVAARRWAVEKLHSAYAKRWRFEVAARKERRQQWEEEEAKRSYGGKKVRGGLGGLWAEILRLASKKSGGVDDDSDSDGPFWFFKGWGGTKKGQTKDDADADCCDAVGESVLTSEIDASKTLSYVTEQVFGKAGVGQAQEERARVLSKLDDNDPAWSPPEKALTPAKIVGMISVLLTVAFDVAIPTTAAVGA